MTHGFQQGSRHGCGWCTVSRRSLAHLTDSCSPRAESASESSLPATVTVTLHLLPVTSVHLSPRSPKPDLWEKIAVTFHLFLCLPALGDLIDTVASKSQESGPQLRVCHTLLQAAAFPAAAAEFMVFLPGNGLHLPVCVTPHLHSQGTRVPPSGSI